MKLASLILAVLVTAGFCISQPAMAQVNPGSAPPGYKPRDIAVSPDGATVLVTSDGSHSMTQFINGVKHSIGLGAPSWGVDFINDKLAVVSVTYGIVVLARPDASANFVVNGGYATVGGADFEYSTTVLAVPGLPGENEVLVANRGTPVPGAESWTHSVHQISVKVGQAPRLTRTFITEREPRALALSPDKARLFVGTIQGALGGPGLITPNSHLADAAYDGGSIVMYDFSEQGSGSPLARFAIGSPVRGMAVWKGTIDQDYLLYFSHVGEGAASEAPEFGGRTIPNVISSFGFDFFTHEPQSRRDVVLSHCPDGVGSGTGYNCGDNLHAIPEDLLVHQTDASDRLWVTFSGSGAVAAIDLTPSGGIHVNSTLNLTSFLDDSELGMFVDDRDQDAELIMRGVNLSEDRFVVEVANPNYFTTLAVDGDPLSPLVVLDGSELALPGSGPRGLAYNASMDAIQVVARFNQTIDNFDAATPSPMTDGNEFWDIALNNLSFAGIRTSDNFEQEVRFFTAGGGFDFRELATPGEAPVDNMSCGTCHVDGHVDGKVRLTVKQRLFSMNNHRGPAPVAVPSVFDVGETEWLFFEGLITIGDRQELRPSVPVPDAPNDSCGYCNIGSFFLDTPEFTNEIQSPHSPWTTGTTLNASEQRGRAVFDALNCSRCHANDIEVPEPPMSPFARSGERSIGASGAGPNPLPASSRMLSDPTHIFVSLDLTVNEDGIIDENASLRNMTDVGTRRGVTDNISGINTPSLAGAWDNAPYFHDGRYRDLDEVLRHTWLDGDLGHQSASRIEPGHIPNNYSNGVGEVHQEEIGRFGVTRESRPPEILVDPFSFETHSHEAPEQPGDWQTVESYLSGGDYDDLLAFLRSLSSEKEPYTEAGLELFNVAVGPSMTSGFARVSFDTNIEIIGRVRLSLPGETPEDPRLFHPVQLTPFGTSHSVDVPLTHPETGQDAYSDDWRVDVGTSYGFQQAEESIGFQNGVFDNLLFSLGCDEISWTTTSSTECTLDWGPASQAYPQNRVTTPAGTSHSANVTLQPGVQYRAIAWAPGIVGQVSTKKYKFCGSRGPIAAGDDPDTPTVPKVEFRVTPNPFNPRTTIEFGLASAGLVDIRIFDVRGRLIRTVVSEHRSSGQHSEVWDGTDDVGSSVASGVYYLKLVAGKKEHRAKLLLVE